MIKSAAAIVFAAMIAPAAAQEKTVHYGKSISLSAEDKAIWRGAVERAGYNCPNPGPMFEEGEDGRGKIFRLHCIAINGQDVSWWDMRVIMLADRLRIERW